MIFLSKEKLFLADPYNEVHIKAISSFEKENNLKEKTSKELKKIKDSYLKEQYFGNRKNANELILDLFLEEDGVIRDSCHIYGEKDIKNCKITFAPIQSSIRKRMIRLATDYALDILSMEEVFLTIEKKDKLIISYLELYGYENLGEEKGRLLFLKEKI